MLWRKFNGDSIELSIKDEVEKAIQKEKDRAAEELLAKNSKKRLEPKNNEETNHESASLMKKLIEEEDSHNQITDDQVVKILAKDGIKLSRRTVAKYRDQMSIPGSRERRAVV